MQQDVYPLCFKHFMKQYDNRVSIYVKINIKKFKIVTGFLFAFKKHRFGNLIAIKTSANNKHIHSSFSVNIILSFHQFKYQGFQNKPTPFVFLLSL